MDKIDISEQHIDYKRKVGTLKGKPVVELRTTGGLNLIAVAENGAPKVLGCGPHRAVSRYIAQKKEPDIQWTDLSKSDHVDFSSFEYILPQYEQLTEAFRAAQE